MVRSKRNRDGYLAANRGNVVLIGENCSDVTFFNISAGPPVTIVRDKLSRITTREVYQVTYDLPLACVGGLPSVNLSNLCCNASSNAGLPQSPPCESLVTSSYVHPTIQGYAELARDGYMLLAERLRDDAEKEVVRAVLEKKMKTTVDVEGLYQVRG